MTLVLDIREMADATKRLQRACAKVKDDAPDLVGAMVVEQTRFRIHSEKTAPDGTKWPRWSARYAKTRHKNQSLLEGRGLMRDSIFYVTHNDGTIELGSNVKYAASHQYGDEERHIKARPYLGLSRANMKDLADALEAYLYEVMP